MTEQGKRSWAPRFTLTQRILGTILAGLAVIGALQVWYSERVLEEAMLQQVRHQAVAFLRGIEGQMQSADSPISPETLQPLLHRAAHADSDEHHFAILALYFYDTRGRVMAHEPPGDFPAKSLQGRYGEVLKGGRPFLGQEVEQEIHPVTGESVPSSDVIIPVRIGGRVVGGLEAELDLGRTVAEVRALDDRYETELTLMLLAAGALLLAFVWTVVHRGLVYPVRRIGEATHRIAEGELTTRIGRHGQDEIGLLSLSIDRMADSIEDLFEEQEKAYLGTLKSLAKALEAKDSYTAGHSGRVARFSVLLGQRVGLDEQELKLLKQGALMHDLGKIGIPDAILNKPAALEEHEYEVMQSHPELTYTIMKPLGRFKAFAEIARWHHERWDGNGYPDGLAGDAVPLLARIVAIADTWDAMTGDRIYRRGMSVEKALGILEAERDSGQWDPKLLDHFIDMIRDERRARRSVAEDILAAEAQT